MKIEGIIRTHHEHAACVAASIRTDNLRDMNTRADGDMVITRITGTHVRSVIASMDDYLTNIAVADDICTQTGEHRIPDRQNTGDVSKETSS